MAGFSELIKNFEKVRGYVRDFFIYGYKVRGDFDKKSARTYDDEKRRVESWLGEHMVYDDSVRGRHAAISVDSGRIAENPLYQAFYTRSFTDNDIRLHFLLLDIMSDGEKHTSRELCDIMNEGFRFCPEEQTVRLKLKEYAGEGIMLCEKRGRTVYYRLSGDHAEDWLDSEGIKNAVRFFSETGELGLVGNTILKTAGLKNERFFMKHNYIVHALEDEVLLTVLQAISGHNELKVTTASPNGGTQRSVVVPMQVLVSVQTGRRFLAAWTAASGRFCTMRLDHMQLPEEGGVCSTYDEIAARYAELSKRSFGVSLAQVSGAVPLRVVIEADEHEERFIIDRLEREKRCGVVEKTGENEFTVTLDICDPTEAMKWVKSFIGRIKRIEGGTEGVRDRFRSDIERMYKMYGGDADEDIQ